MNLRSVSPEHLSLLVAAALMLVSSGSRAQSFFDDFEDGSASDGNPVTWSPFFNQGSVYVENGRLVMDSPGVGRNTLGAYVVESGAFRDGVLRTQVRVDNFNFGAVGMFARSPDNDAILASINAAGLMRVELLVGGNNHLLHIPVAAANPIAKDVILEFSLIGNEAALTAWAVGQPRPTQAQVVADVSAYNHEAGEIGVWFAAESTTRNRALFDYFQVVPEPSTGLLLMVGLSFMGRRRR